MAPEDVTYHWSQALLPGAQEKFPDHELTTARKGQLYHQKQRILRHDSERAPDECIGQGCGSPGGWSSTTSSITDLLRSPSHRPKPWGVPVTGPLTPRRDVTTAGSGLERDGSMTGVQLPGRSVVGPNRIPPSSVPPHPEKLLSQLNVPQPTSRVGGVPGAEGTETSWGGPSVHTRVGGRRGKDLGVGVVTRTQKCSTGNVRPRRVSDPRSPAPRTRPDRGADSRGPSRRRGVVRRVSPTTALTVRVDSPRTPPAGAGQSLKPHSKESSGVRRTPATWTVNFWGF